MKNISVVSTLNIVSPDKSHKKTEALNLKKKIENIFQIDLITFANHVKVCQIKKLKRNSYIFNCEKKLRFISQ